MRKATTLSSSDRRKKQPKAVPGRIARRQLLAVVPDTAARAATVPAVERAADHRAAPLIGRPRRRRLGDALVRRTGKRREAPWIRLVRTRRVEIVHGDTRGARKMRRTRRYSLGVRCRRLRTDHSSARAVLRSEGGPGDANSDAGPVGGRGGRGLQGKARPTGGHEGHVGNVDIRASLRVPTPKAARRDGQRRSGLLQFCRTA